MVMDGSKLTMHTEFSHFGYLDADDRVSSPICLPASYAISGTDLRTFYYQQAAILLWSFFFVLCALTLIWNCALIHHFYTEQREFPEQGRSRALLHRRRCWRDRRRLWLDRRWLVLHRRWFWLNRR